MYIHSLSIHDLNKILKVRCWYIAIGQKKKNKRSLNALAVPQRNTYTGPVSIMLCAKPRAYGRGGEPCYCVFTVRTDDCSLVIVL